MLPSHFQQHCQNRRPQFLQADQDPWVVPIVIVREERFGILFDHRVSLIESRAKDDGIQLLPKDQEGLLLYAKAAKSIGASFLDVGKFQRGLSYLFKGHRRIVPFPRVQRIPPRRVSNTLVRSKFPGSSVFYNTAAFNFFYSVACSMKEAIRDSFRSFHAPGAGTLQPMNAETFRRIVLGLKDAIESSHMDHPDFRVNGKVFATLKHDGKSGMVKLTPEQQREFIEEDPKTFSPEAGAWGRMGCTKVVLATADADTVGRALTLGRQNLLQKLKKGSPAKPGQKLR